MSVTGFSSGKNFRLRHTALVSSIGIPAAVLCVLYLVMILQMTDDQWAAFGQGVLVAFVFLAVVIPIAQTPFERVIADAIDRDEEGTLDDEQLELAVVHAVRLPRRDVLQALLTWLGAALFIPVFMHLNLETLSTFTLVVVVLASSSSGVIAAVFAHFAVKRQLSSLTNRWLNRIEDPARRRELIPTTTIGRKLAIPLSAVSMVSLLFALVLSYTLSYRPVEAQDHRVKTAYGAYVVEELGKDPSQLANLEKTGVAFAAAEHLLIVERSSGRIVSGDSRGIEAAELLWLLGTGELSGNSSLFDSANSFVWAPLDETGERLLLSVTAGSTFTSGQRSAQMAFVGLMFTAVGIILLTCFLLSWDVTHTTRRLIERAQRVASGDLVNLEVVESDDELGVLARAFDEMIGSLREMIRQVASAADGLEGAVVGLDQVGADVTDATQDQRAGIEQATAQVASVNRKVSEITESAQALNFNVEEASSSVLELGAASEELNQTAMTLSSHVEEVTGSVEQMIRSVAQVGNNTDGLAQGISETSSSMSEMAAAMAEVDRNASETARLSNQVVKLSESGQERVHETISGMDSIRDATETADAVIQGLGSRVVEIGAIVDVIDDVADETNLLALNAAIIAAQAGDQGRSFSVVADEIKDLADRVLTSTKEIGDLIRAVQEESANATSAIGRGSERVQRGVELAAEAGLALEEITSASRESGARIEEIVNAVRDQTSAAGHVAGLMERVLTQVEEIRRAGLEQEQSNGVIQASAHIARDVAQQTQQTTEEQSRGAGRIRDSMESIRDAVDQIHAGLQEQSDSCRATVSFLEQVFERTSSNEASSLRLGGATRELTLQASALRQDVERFRIDESEIGESETDESEVYGSEEGSG